MATTTEYRAVLRATPDWDALLLRESRLPGPRANLELLHAVADEGEAAQFRRWLELDASRARANSPGEFLPACGAVGLGRLAAEGDPQALAELRHHASDARWRVREGVAMGLQRLGARDMPALLREMKAWSDGGWLERRAVVAAVCEPALLRDPVHAHAVLDMLDALMAEVGTATDRRDTAFRTFRQALGYGLSVAVAALPDRGKPLFERWLASADPDVRWIVRENLKKNRLKRLDPVWTARHLAQLSRHLEN